MISKLEVLETAKKLSLQPFIIEKDYVLGWILIAIQHFFNRDFSWIFKGGTCLKKCYFYDYRFSEDLDFSLVNELQLDEKNLKQKLKRLSEWVYEETGIIIPQEKLSIETYSNLQGFPSIQVKIAYWGPLQQKQKTNLPTIKLDLTSHEEIVLPPEKREIFHPYSDKPSNTQAICYSFEEIFAEKMRALSERARPRDLYDIIHLYEQRSHVRNKTKLLDTLERKCAFKKINAPSLKTMKTHPNRRILSSEWENMLKHQLSELKPFEYFWEQLPNILDWFQK